jgi:hypothetical protein
VGVVRVAARALRPLDGPAVDDAPHQHGVDAGPGEQEVGRLRDAVAVLLAHEADVADQEVVVGLPPLERGLDHVHHRRAHRLGGDLAQQGLVDGRRQERRGEEVGPRRLEHEPGVGADAVHERGGERHVLGVVGIEPVGMRGA